jgi:hypothetical protein
MIFVECYADLVLLTSSGIATKRDIMHEFKGKGEICQRLRRATNGIGMIDEDPASAQPRLVVESRVIEDIPQHGIKVLSHYQTKSHLLVLCPYLEVWFLVGAQQAKIDITKFNLPDKPHQLRKMIRLDTTKFEKACIELSQTGRLTALKQAFQIYT